jgi:hypothetical protein
MQCLAVNIVFQLTMFKEGAGNVFLWLVNISKLVAHCTPKFCKLIEMREEMMSFCICVVQSEVKMNCLVCEGRDLVCD